MKNEQKKNFYNKKQTFFTRDQFYLASVRVLFRIVFRRPFRNFRLRHLFVRIVINHRGRFCNKNVDAFNFYHPVVNGNYRLRYRYRQSFCRNRNCRNFGIGQYFDFGRSLSSSIFPIFWWTPIIWDELTSKKQEDNNHESLNINMIIKRISKF